MIVSTQNQKTNCCNDFWNYRGLIVPSELWCQFISHHVILEPLIVSSLCLISKELGSGALMETQPGPRAQPTELKEVEVLVVQLLQDIVETLLIPGLESLKREIFGFLLDWLWNIPKISVRINRILQSSITFNYLWKSMSFAIAKILLLLSELHRTCRGQNQGSFWEKATPNL